MSETKGRGLMRRVHDVRVWEVLALLMAGVGSGFSLAGNWTDWPLWIFPALGLTTVPVLVAAILSRRRRKDARLNYLMAHACEWRSAMGHMCTGHHDLAMAEVESRIYDGSKPPVCERPIERPRGMGRAREVQPKPTNLAKCRCYVLKLPLQDALTIRWGAHEIECPTYQPSLDPVDRANDEEYRAFHLDGEEESQL